MNKEDYVSLEVAKLLKEKGFKEPCVAYYWNDKLMPVRSQYRGVDIDGILDFSYSVSYNNVLAPSLYQAQKWLRSTKRLHVEANYMYGDYWIYEILTIPEHYLTGFSDRENTRYMSYEYALQAGILEALKLI